mgnify:CR=1 FL=1
MRLSGGARGLLGGLGRGHAAGVHGVDHGGEAIGVALTVAAIPLWVQLSLIDECRVGIDRHIDGAGQLSSLPLRPLAVHA